MGMKFLEENLLDHLRRPEFAQLRDSFHVRAFAKGGLLFTPSMHAPDDASENLVFIISSGRVRVYLAYEDKEFNLGILSRGDIYSSHSDTFVQALGYFHI